MGQGNSLIHHVRDILLGCVYPPLPKEWLQCYNDSENETFSGAELPGGSSADKHDAMKRTPDKGVRPMLRRYIPFQLLPYVTGYEDRKPDLWLAIAL